MFPKRAISSLAAVLLLQGVPAGAPAAEPGVAIAVTGPEQVVFRHATDACDLWHIPDAPARAFRDAAGTVHLVAAHDVNRAMTGPDLNRVRVDCRVIFEGAHRDDPAQFDDRAWLAGFYTVDGRTVHALVHNEWQGHRRPDRCPAATYMRCWYNAVTAAVSRDGGYRFERAGKHALVAALPYRFDPASGRHAGYFGPSNIVRHAGHFYAMIFTERRGAQQRGVCLIRTADLGEPGAWRAWDGGGFTVAFADPYRQEVASPDRHVCRPLPGLSHAVGSVTRDEASGLFIAVMLGGREAETGLFYATSPDLLSWSGMRPILRAPHFGRWRCGEPSPVGYPSLLDPDSPSASFETVSGQAFLYLTRFNPEGCRLGPDRDLVRLPVTVTPLR